MRRIGLILVFLLLFVGMMAAQDTPPPNILSGHEVTAIMPDMVVVTTKNEIGISWTGSLVLAIDGRDSATIVLPVASATLPRRRWTAKDYIITIGVIIVSSGSGLVAGHLLL